MPSYEWPSPLDPARLHKILSEHPAFNNPNVSLPDATISLSPEKHSGRRLLLDRAAGVTATLPASTGLGDVYLFQVKTKATSNNHIVKVANTTDIIQGTLSTIDTDTAGTITGWAAGASDDTVTLNRSTTGSASVGEWFELHDIAKGVWAIRGQVSNTGSGATPFSATV